MKLDKILESSPDAQPFTINKILEEKDILFFFLLVNPAGMFGAQSEYRLLFAISLIFKIRFWGGSAFELLII